MPEIRPIKVTGTPGGIYQGPNPPPNTVQDMCNIDTSTGMWSTRPGANKYIRTNTSEISGIAEYLSDNRYAVHDKYDGCPVSNRSCLLVTTGRGVGASGFVEEIFNPTHKRYHSMPASQTQAAQCRYVGKQMLHRTVHSDGGVTYAPVMVFSNGVDTPFYYSQRNTGVPVLADLESLSMEDSGFSFEPTTLPEPPRGSCMAIFNGVLFMGNVEGGSNRIAYSGVDGAGIPVCNVWPSDQVINIGTAGESIREMVPFKDVLFVFTDRQVYALSGDGVDGAYRIDSVFTESGANTGCAVDVGDSVFFMSDSGVYRTNGASTARVSHPALEDTWEKIDVGNEHNCALFDPQRSLVFFSTTTSSDDAAYGPYSDVVLVYDLKNGAWSRWGSWSGTAGDDPDSYFAMWGGVVSHVLLNEPTLMFNGYETICHFEGSSDPKLGGIGTPLAEFYWFIKTHRYFDEDDRDKVLRYCLVKTNKTGLWNLLVVPFTDEDDNLVDAAIRKSGTNWCFLADQASSVYHTMAPYVSPAPFKTPSDGPVDIYDVRTMRKLYDSQTLSTSSQVTDIKFSSAVVTGGKGNELVVKEDVADVFKTSMASRSMFATSIGASYAVKFAGPSAISSNLDDAAFFESPRPEEVMSGSNIVGKHFGLWMSGNGYWADVVGWGLWVRPLRTLRPR